MTQLKKKVAILCFSPSWGGMELDAIRLYGKLEGHYDVWLVCKEDSAIHKYAKLSTNNVKQYRSIKFKTMFSLVLIFGLRTFFKKEDIKNIIFFGASEIRSIFFALLRLNVNLIVRHGTTKAHSKKDFFHKLLYSKVNHYVGISKHLVNNINEILPVKQGAKVHLIYPSFRSFTEKRTDQIIKKIKIIHVGRLVDGKGQDAALRACSILYEKRLPFELNFVGAGNRYKEELEKIVKNLPYADSVFFKGHLTDIYPLLLSSHIFLFPTAGEGFGNSLVEALSCGLVCITYSNTTMPEIINLGFYGYLVENRNEEQLKKTLLFVAENINVEITNSEANMELVREVFSIEREVTQFDSLLV